MSDTVKPRNRTFLKTEIVLLICVILVWVGKLVTVDIDSTKSAVFRQLVKIRPNDAHAHKLLGDAYSDLYAYGRAIGAYKEAIRIDPNDSEAYRNLASLYLSLFHYEDAIDFSRVESFKEAVRLNPKHFDAQCSLAGCYRTLGQYKDSIDATKKAIEIKPDCAFEYLCLGDDYFELGRYEEAIQTYNQFLEIDIEPDMTDPAYVHYAEVHLQLGKAYLKTDDKDLALEQYEILKTLDEELANELYDLIQE